CKGEGRQAPSIGSGRADRPWNAAAPVIENKEALDDRRNENDESTPRCRLRTRPDSDRRRVRGDSIRCPGSGLLAHPHRRVRHPPREGGRHARAGDGRHAGRNPRDPAALSEGEDSRMVFAWRWPRSRPVAGCEGRAEAKTIMEGLPLGKENLMDHEYIAVGPL